MDKNIKKTFSKKVYKQVTERKDCYIFHIHELLEDIPSKNIKLTKPNAVSINDKRL